MKKHIFKDLLSLHKKYSKPGPSQYRGPFPPSSTPVELDGGFSLGGVDRMRLLLPSALVQGHSIERLSWLRQAQQPLSFRLWCAHTKSPRNTAEGSFLHPAPTNTVKTLPQAWQAENTGTSFMLTRVCRPPPPCPTHKSGQCFERNRPFPCPQI